MFSKLDHSIFCVLSACLLVYHIFKMSDKKYIDIGTRKIRIYGFSNFQFEGGLIKHDLLYRQVPEEIYFLMKFYYNIIVALEIRYKFYGISSKS